MKRKDFFAGRFSAAAAVGVGSILITQPLFADDGADVIAVLLAVLLSFVGYLTVYPLLRGFLYAEPNDFKGMGVGFAALGYLVITGLLLISAIKPITILSKFTADIFLKEVNLGAVTVALFVCAVLLAALKDLALMKTVFILFLISTFMVVLIFVFSLKDMNVKYITPDNTVSVSDLVKTALEIFFESFAGGIIAVSALGFESGRDKAVLIGNATAGGIILLTSLNTLLIFGGGFGCVLSYPYATAVTRVATGDVMTGLEGGVYLSIFCFCISKAAVCLLGAARLSRKILSLKNLN